MYHEMTFAGFGGQGVLYAARLLAYAAMIQDLHVAWVPVYGPEMRGGAASASVLISDKDIDSLVVTHPDTGVFMNQPSLDKYGDCVKAGGVILFNSSLIVHGSERTDVTVVPVPANETAHALGDDRAANMVMLGAAVRVTGVVPLTAVLTAFDQTAKDKESALYRFDRAALAQGADDRAPPDL
jgi:2-oxoglutarate ferredoxin oxidoreductase subunit gamma